jgi:glutamate dehydrogenase/leucine dehydrogenase
MIPFTECNEKIWDVPAEIFVPAASSRLVSDDQAKRMVNQCMEVISCGANVPFQDKEIFFGPITEYVDDNISLLPDFIANCGMARVFAYLMGQNSNSKITDEAIFNDVSGVIRKSLEDTHRENTGKTKIAQTAFSIALRELV